MIINNLLTNRLSEVPATEVVCCGLSRVMAVASSVDSWRVHCPGLELRQPEQYSLACIFILNKPSGYRVRKTRALLLTLSVEFPP